MPNPAATTLDAKKKSASTTNPEELQNPEIQRLQTLVRDNLARELETYESKKPTVQECLDYVFNYGKYKGKTYREVLESDPVYFRWSQIQSNNFSKSYTSELLLDTFYPDWRSEAAKGRYARKV